MSRQRAPLAFGGSGVVRGTGLLTTEPASLADLRNVTLRPGRALRRGGLTARATLASEDAIIGVHPIRSQGVGACLAYRASTREVRLYLVAPDGSSTLVGLVWTLQPAAGFPRVSLTDVFDRLIIAHDEAVYSSREPTRVFTPTTNTISTLEADLFTPTTPPTPVPVRFRGVTRYLTYLVGWGYGTENAADGDNNRPEIVRVSMPDNPLAFRPEHYFLAGQRGDPVLGCYEAGGVLAVRKAAESHEITGYDRATFGIRPIDSLFGVASSRLGVVVGSRNYFWSLEGPRMAAGGASQDMALPLDLRGPAVDALQSTDPADAFACYDPSERAVLFIFGRWGFAWHLEAESWSFRQYGARLYAGGILYRDTAATGLGPQSAAAFTSASSPAPAAAAPATITATAAVTGTLLGGEVLELWGRPAGGTWARIGTAAVTALGANTVTAASVAYGTSFELAVRVTLNAIGQSGAAGTNPDDWPASTRGGPIISTLPTIAARSDAGLGPSYFSSVIPGLTVIGGRGVLVFFLTMPSTASGVQYDSRTRPVGGGAWSEWEPAQPVDLGARGLAVMVAADPVANLQREVEIRPRTAAATGAGTLVSAGATFGPRQPTGYTVAIGTPTVHTITASPEPVVFIRDDAEFQVARNGTAPANILGGADISPHPVPIAFEGTTATAQTVGGGAHFVRVRIRLGSIDFFSPWRPAT